MIDDLSTSFQHSRNSIYPSKATNLNELLFKLKGADYGAPAVSARI
jgi:hypothetical protein